MFRGANISPATAWERIITEGLVDDSESGSVSDGDANNTGEVVHVSFSEAFRAVKGVNPDS